MPAPPVAACWRPRQRQQSQSRWPAVHKQARVQQMRCHDSAASVGAGHHHAINFVSKVLLGTAATLGTACQCGVSALAPHTCLKAAWSGGGVAAAPAAGVSVSSSDTGAAATPVAASGDAAGAMSSCTGQYEHVTSHARCVALTCSRMLCRNSASQVKSASQQSQAKVSRRKIAANPAIVGAIVI